MTTRVLKMLQKWLNRGPEDAEFGVHTAGTQVVKRGLAGVGRRYSKTRQ